MVARRRSVVLSITVFLLVTLFLPGASVSQQFRVTPDGGSLVVALNGTQKTASFVLYTGVSTLQTWHITPTCSGVIQGCFAPNGYDVTFQQATGVDIKFSTPVGGSGRVTLLATRLGVSDTGWINVTVDATPPEVRLVVPTGDVGVEFPTIQIAWCDNASSLNSAVRWIKVNGVLKTSNFDYVANSGPPDCTVKATSTSSTAALSLGSNVIEGHICDNLNNCTTTSFTIIRLVQGVAVRPELPQRQHFATTSGSQRFFVKNTRGSGASTMTVGFQCTGSVSGCGVSPTSLVSVPPGESRVVTLTYTVGAAGAGSGMVKAFDNTFRDSATVAVTAINAPAPLVSVVDVNPGATLRRDLCVTIAGGSLAAIECGDLRIVHPLPTIRTHNKSRTPALLYNSANAELFAIVAGTVTLPSSGSMPDSVEGVLRVNGLARATGRWGGSSDWSALGATRRIALAWAVSPDTIRPDTVYDYTFEATALYPAPYTGTATGKLIVVDRRGSGFGAGWSLAGLERIRFLANNDRLWVGGDGSARIYFATSDTNKWVAAADQRPDTLKKLPGGPYYRAVPGGAKIWFGATGLHDSTVNRLGQRTKFGYMNGLLTSITLPDTLVSPSGGQVYSFSYDSSAPPARLVTITAPGARVTKLFLTSLLPGSLRVDSIQDPDNSKARFTFENGTSRRIATRKDRRGTVTTYSYDVAKKVWRLHTDLQPDSIRTGFAAIENQGLSIATPKTAIDTANAYSTFSGPRQYATRPSDLVSQQTLFYIDRFGATRRVRDALNNWTVVKREDGQWPTRPTDVVDASGFETKAGYDSRGNLIRRVAVNPLGPGQDAVARYHWDTLWTAVDSIITPLGVVTTIAYSPQNGNRLYQQVGSDPIRRVSFNYGNVQNLLSSVVVQSIKKDSVLYSGQWNVAASRTARGFWTSYYSDAIGRDTMAVTPIDSTDKGRGGAADSTARVRQRTVFTMMNRDSISESISPNRTQVVHIDKRYDLEGNDTSLARVASPDLAGIGTVTTRWRYNRANRRVAEIAPDGMVDSTDYDPAGNVVNAVTRRKDPTSGTRLAINMTYDALNRLTARVLPQITYQSRPTGFIIQGTPFVWTAQPFSAYAIPSETHTFTYDPIGRLLTADNAEAKVKRSYYPGGLLETDSLRIQTVGHTDWTIHKYGLRNTYDLDGRRTLLAVPHQLGIGNDTTIAYAYDPQLGFLQSVTALQGTVYTLGYSVQGDLNSIGYPGLYSEALGYDIDGQLTADTIRNNGSPNYPRIQSGPFVRNTGFLYDGRHKLLSSGDVIQLRDSVQPTYSGLGSVTATHWVEHGCFGCSIGVNDRHATGETFTRDALGNVTQSYVGDTLNGVNITPTGFNWTYTSSTSCCDTWTYQPGTGRMLTMSAAQQMTRSFYYDSAGNQEFSSAMDPLNGKTATERASFFAADGSLRMVDARAAKVPHVYMGDWQTYSVEDYRYDALGRRVWVRTRRWCDDDDKDWPAATECRVGTLRRTVWDGDREVAEIQMPWALQGTTIGGYDTTRYASLWENDTSPISTASLPLLNVAGSQTGDPNPYFGHVIYAGRREVDQPIAITRVNYVMGEDWQYRSQFTYNPPRLKAAFTLAPFWNARGDAPVGVFATGDQFQCGVPHLMPTNMDTACVAIRWPYNWSSSERNGGLPHDYWHGTLLDGKRDGSGFRYMRNRYYDPLTGRFTQEDPIGLAGGLNTYGFGQGDAINFSDPFGLTACSEHKFKDYWTFEVVTTGKTVEVIPTFHDCSQERKAWQEFKAGQRRRALIHAGEVIKQGFRCFAGSFAVAVNVMETVGLGEIGAGVLAGWTGAVTEAGVYTFGATADVTAVYTEAGALITEGAAHVGGRAALMVKGTELVGDLAAGDLSWKSFVPVVGLPSAVETVADNCPNIPLAYGTYRF